MGPAMLQPCQEVLLGTYSLISASTLRVCLPATR